MGSILEVSDLKKSYGDMQAVNGISFKAAQGEILGLLGPNGAGKTTTLECLTGLRHPDQGTILLFGTKNGSALRAIRDRLGVQLQTTGLFPHLTVLEQLQLFAGLYSNSLCPAAVLSLVNLEGKAKTLTRDLSGGQQQRLTLGLALINQPDLSILDEPTTGLDPQSRRATWNLITALRRSGKSVLLSTHSMEEASVLCDRVVIIDNGRIIEEGVPQALIQKHFQESVLEIPFTASGYESHLRRLPGVTQTRIQNGTTLLYSTDIPRTLAGMYGLRAQNGWELADLAVRQASLEDVFLKLTGRRIRS